MRTPCRKCGVAEHSGTMPSNLCVPCRQKIESDFIDRFLAEADAKAALDSKA